MVELKLTKPVKAHGELMSVLNFREPTGADMAACGFPFKFENNGPAPVRMIDAAAVNRYISELCGIPPSSVAQLSAIDWTRAMGEVVGFLAEPETVTTKDS